MKKLIILITVILCFVSCNHKNDPENIPQSFTSGKWHIIDYQKNGKEKQDLYAAFDFTFSKDNHIIAKSDSYNYTGEWLIIKSDITDDAPITDIDFDILFSYKNDLSELSGEWKIVKRTNSYLSLIQINEDGEDHLIFKKST